MNRWILRSALLIAAIVAAGAGLYLGSGMKEKLEPVDFRYEESKPHSLLSVGEDFPDIPLMRTDGTIISTSTILESGGVVIFMELGCAPCSVMSANWSEAIQTWADHPPIVGISIAPIDQIERYRDNQSVKFPILRDTGMVFETAYQVIDFPLRLIVDRSHLVRGETYDSHEIIDTAMIAALIRGDTNHVPISR